MTTIESNKLIAEFMGGEFCITPQKVELGENVIDTDDNGEDVYDDKWDDVECVSLFDNESGELIQISWPVASLNYNVSWDWLMPVAKKIKELIYELKGTDPYLHLCAIHNSLDEMDIKVLYEKVIEFIKWYNELKDKYHEVEGTHVVLDLVCSVGEGQECFSGSLKECHAFIKSQGNEFLYSIVPVIRKK